MNCINHPTAEVAAYCQQCGKPMCNECMRPVGSMVYCEPCLAARLGVPAAGQVPPVHFPPSRPNPVLAGLLGFIPGVGAMYNGQFVKALAHVLIFAVFVSLSDRSTIFGILVAAWVVYQAFDAYHTAKARLEGLPLPNPFGLNDLGARLGIPQTPPPPPAAPYASSFAGDAASSVAGGSGMGAAPGTGSGFGAAAGQQPAGAAVPPNVPPPPYWTGEPVAPANGVRGSRAPVGAIVLIIIGLFLLFQTLGLLHGEWIDRSWPLLIVGLGAWLLYRRTHETPGGGPQ
jgi:TM2 domain-containing membrane protein YozV